MRLFAALAFLTLLLPASVRANPQVNPMVNVLGAPAPVAARAAAEGSPELQRLLDRPGDLWERIRLGFAMPELDHKLVARYEAQYSGKSAESLGVILVRARRYLHYIVDEIERRGMPTELALLPIVESGFNPMALSSAKASGLWQFIPATGTRYKLAQNAQFDERRDVLASTGAALDYLQALYEMHKDWHLALASYNWGENAVARAADRSRSRGRDGQFASLAMPEETRHYVPRLMALRNLVAEPEKFGLDLGALPNEPYFEVVANVSEVPLAVAAKLADLSQDELVALNPAWKKPRIAGDKGPGLVLPIDRVEIFRANFARWEEEQLLEKSRRKPRGKSY
jgi:membrane-bound lytic murein transglycosylase D